LPVEEDLSKMTVEHLAGWGLPVAWLATTTGGTGSGMLALGPRQGWAPKGGHEPGLSFQVALGKNAAVERLGQDEKVVKQRAGQPGREDLALVPVAFGARVFGVLVVGGAGRENAAKLELLPQLAQTFAIALAARSAEAKA